MTAGTRVTSYLGAIKTALDATSMFQNVRIHVDPFDMADVLKETFKTPAARVIFALGKPEANADGGYDCRLHFVIAVITGRTGRPAPDMASADDAAMTLTFDTMSAITADPYFNQVKVSPAKPTAVRVAISEKNSKEGLAIVVVEYQALMLKMVPAWPEISAMFTAGGTVTLGLDGTQTLQTPPVVSP